MVATPVLAFRLLLGVRCGPCVMIAQSSHSPSTLQLLTAFLLGVALDFQMCEAWRPDYQSTCSGCTRHRTSWGGEEMGWECLSDIFPPSSHSWWQRSWNRTRPSLRLCSRDGLSLSFSPSIPLDGFQEPRALRLAISTGREPRTAGTAASRTSSGLRCCMANCQGSVSIPWTHFFALKT